MIACMCFMYVCMYVCMYVELSPSDLSRDHTGLLGLYRALVHSKLWAFYIWSNM